MKNGKMNKATSASALPAITAIVGMLMLSACGGDIDFGFGGGDDDNGSGQATVSAVTLGNKLITFNQTAPGIVLSSNSISGLQGGDSIVGIDFRPANRKLYILTNNAGTGRIYTLSGSGAATLVATLAVTGAPSAACPGGYTGLVGTQFGVNFNPVSDRLRVVSNSEQNLRIDVSNGAVCTDSNITPAGDVSAAAYTNSFGALGVAASTTLYVIDSVDDQLLIQNPPNDGTLTSPQPLGVNFATPVSLDINGVTGQALAASSTGISSSLYKINLATGAASLVGAIGGGEIVTGIAVPVPQQPRVFAYTSGNTLVSFDPLTPETVTTIGAITGLQAGEDVLGMDFRPETDDLYVLGDSGRVYRIKVSTGASQGSVTLAPPAVPNGDCPGGFTALPATGGFAVDFNPVTDRLRVVAGADAQNLRINVDNGVTCKDADVNPGAPAIVGAAYTNNFAGAGSTQLYDLDSSTNPAHLLLQNPPNDGDLADTGSLTVATTDNTGFDIAGGHNGLVLASLNQGSLYRVNLTTGAATPIGIIGGVTPLLVNGIAIQLRED